MAKKKKDKSDKKSDAKRKGKKSDKKRDVKSKDKSKDKKKDKAGKKRDVKSAVKSKDKKNKKKVKAGKTAKASSKKADPGASVRDAELYETLRADGNSKKKSARIANAAAASSREDVAERGGSAPAYHEWTRAALYDRAKDVGLPGRSTMNKQELVDALRDS